MNKPSMIIFDYGDTLFREINVDFLRAEREIFKYVTANPMNVTPEKACGAAMKVFEKFSAVRKIGFEIDECQVQRLTNALLGLEFSVSEAEIADLIFRNSCELEPMPHVAELLGYLKSAGIRTAVLSNISWLRESLERRIQESLPESDFEFVITSSEYGIRKPDPAIFEAALKKAGLNADEVWFCGDSYAADVQGSKNAGMMPVWYSHETGDCLTVRDWRELIGIIERL